jgi:hypothetical protein
MTGLLRIEARRNPAPLVLPLLALLLAITPLARDLTPVGLWLDRSVDVEGSVQLIGPFAAGAATWTASRDHRRRMADLLASTPRNYLARTMAAWLVSAAWLAGFYVVLAATFLSITATQATWGGPQWWPVLDGLVAVVTCSAAGHALGLLWPTRFATALAAVGTLAAILGTRSAATTGQAAGIGLLSPIYPTFGLNASVFYAPQPDLAILKIVCYLGVLGLVFGLAAWHFRADRPSARRTGAALLVAGLAVTATAGGLDATARTDSHGVIVPAFHDAAADHEVRYTPVCSHTPLPVCVHPAYDGGSELTVLATVINKIAAPLIGAPGMPLRAEQVPAGELSYGGAQGEPPVLPIQPFIIHGTSLAPPPFAEFFADSIALSLLIPAHSPIERAAPAQRAVALYLLRQAHDPADPHLFTAGPAGQAVTAAAARLAAQRPAARTAWLTTHLTQLRAGRLTPVDIP